VRSAPWSPGAQQNRTPTPAKAAALRQRGHIAGHAARAERGSRHALGSLHHRGSLPARTAPEPATCRRLSRTCSSSTPSSPSRPRPSPGTSRLGRRRSHPWDRRSQPRRRSPRRRRRRSQLPLGAACRSLPDNCTDPRPDRRYHRRKTAARRSRSRSCSRLQRPRRSRRHNRKVTRGCQCKRNRPRSSGGHHRRRG
jgi:hypothetical protein